MWVGFGCFFSFFFFHSPIAFSWYLDHLDNWQLKLELKCCKAAKAMPSEGKIGEGLSL